MVVTGTPGGNRFVTTTVDAELGPTFVTTTERVMFWLAMAGPEAALMVTAISAAAPTLVGMAVVLFDGFGSTSSPDAVTLFVALPERVSVATTVAAPSSCGASAPT